MEVRNLRVGHQVKAVLRDKESVRQDEVKVIECVITGVIPTKTGYTVSIKDKESDFQTSVDPECLYPIDLTVNLLKKLGFSNGVDAGTMIAAVKTDNGGRVLCIYDRSDNSLHIKKHGFPVLDMVYCDWLHELQEYFHVLHIVCPYFKMI